jgi:hypothetical protein
MCKKYIQTFHILLIIYKKITFIENLPFHNIIFKGYNFKGNKLLFLEDFLKKNLESFIKFLRPDF